MPLRFRQRILDHLSHEGYRPANSQAVARDLRIAGEDMPAFDRAVAQLDEEGRVEIDDRERLHLPKAGSTVVGKIKVNARGFGFVIPDDKVREGDIFVPPGNVADAVTGDRVRVEVHRRKHEGEKSIVGRVVEIIERGQAKFVGVLRKEGKQWWVEPDGTNLRDHILIRDPHAKNAKDGDKVAIELVHYPEEQYYAEGVIVEVLGEAGRPSVETRAVITAHGLRDAFPEDVVQEARDAARSLDDVDHLSEGGEREDLRDVFTITIDPPDAKDFDDAISISRDQESGEWLLGVHIADVAHFVRRASALDDEARERGNSVYLPRLVLPMLPEVLSNGVCSLQEGVPRLTKSAFITFDARGRVMSQRLSATLIQSNKRLTYLEAQALIDGDEKEARKNARTDTDYSEQLISTLRMMDTLAKTLRARRRRDGMITLNLKEVDLVFDDEGHVIDVVPEDDAFTHTIIEMFMVEANEAVARVFDDLGVPIIRRIHPDPSVGKMDALQTFAMVAGRKVPDNPTRKDIQQLLEATAEAPAARAIHFAVLRTLTKATYSPALIGHYALASDHYTHFTSPIRRYPDLSVHRAIEAYLDRTDNGRNVPGGKKRRKLGEELLHDDRLLDEAQLIILGNHCSETEQEAEEAERELRGFLVMQFLQEHHLGDRFHGVVTGVMSIGVFVSIDKFLIEGLVKTEDLQAPGGRSDRWKLFEHMNRLVAERSGASIGLGDEVEVQIVSIDLQSRQMELVITKKPDRVTHVPTRRESKRSDTRERGRKHRKGYGRGRRGRRA